MLGTTGNAPVWRTALSVNVAARILSSLGPETQNQLQAAVRSFVCANLCVTKCGSVLNLYFFSQSSRTSETPSVRARGLRGGVAGQKNGPLRWICDFAAEVFITDNYIRMCWKRNKPRTVWVGRCWAHTVPSARCSPASNSPAPAGPLGAWKGSRENTEAPPSQNRLVFDSSPCPSFTSLSSRALSTVQHSELQAQEVGYHYFYSPVTSQMLKIQCILWTSLKMIKCSIEWVILNNYNIITVIDNTYNRKQ